MGDYIMDMRKRVGHIPLMQCGASVIVENERGEILLQQLSLIHIWFSQAASTADGRARFVDSTLVLMERYGFLGVDIDWEYPGSSAAGIASSANDRKNFTLLLQALREGLDSLTAQDGKPRMLAVAMGGDPWHIRNLDVKAIGALCDQVNLKMCIRDRVQPLPAAEHATARSQYGFTRPGHMLDGIDVVNVHGTIVENLHLTRHLSFVC